ncbi:MAG: RNA polymerase sigma factor [Bacteroidia bacterium]
MLSTQSDDSEIFQAFLNTNTKHKAFEILFDKYAKKLYWVARRIVINHDDADDVMQNTWIKIWNNLSGFKEESKLYTWLYKITTNESLLMLQKKKQNLSIDDYQETLSNQLQAGVYFNGNKVQLALQQAVLQLPEKQRLVFNLKYFENMKYEDMEKILDTSIGALKASYHHAVKKVEEILKTNLNV